MKLGLKETPYLGVTCGFQRNPHVARDEESRGGEWIQLVDNTTSSHRYCWSRCR